MLTCYNILNMYIYIKKQKISEAFWSRDVTDAF